MSAFIYRHFDAEGNLLYVGMSNNPINRLDNHRATAAWYHLIRSMTMEECGSMEEAAIKELEAIKNENPIHNISGKNIRIPSEERLKQQVVKSFKINKDVEPLPFICDKGYIERLFNISSRTVNMLFDGGFIECLEIPSSNKKQKRVATGLAIINFIERLSNNTQKPTERENDN